MIKGSQNIVNAQVDINRAVWAVNEDKYFKTVADKKKYLKECAKNAIEELNNFLKLIK